MKPGIVQSLVRIFFDEAKPVANATDEVIAGLLQTTGRAVREPFHIPASVSALGDDPGLYKATTTPGHALIEPFHVPASVKPAAVKETAWSKTVPHTHEAGPRGTFEKKPSGEYVYNQTADEWNLSQAHPELEPWSY